MGTECLPGPATGGLRLADHNQKPLGVPGAFLGRVRTVGGCVWTAEDLEQDPSAWERREAMGRWDAMGCPPLGRSSTSDEPRRDQQSTVVTFRNRQLFATIDKATMLITYKLFYKQG